MDGLQWKTQLKLDDLGVPFFFETPIYTWNSKQPVLNGWKW